MTATQQQRQPSWRLMAAMRRAVRTLRHVNDEMVRANEAIFRPAGAPPNGPGAGTSAAADTGASEAAAPKHSGQAA